DVACGGKSGMDAIAIAGLEADARNTRLGKIFSALGRQLRLPPLDQVETCRAAFFRERKESGTTITIVGEAKHRAQTSLSKRPNRAGHLIEIQNLFKSDELVEGERLREVRAVDIDVEKPLNVLPRRTRHLCLQNWLKPSVRSEQRR